MFEAEDYIGRRVEVEGWFRRGLTPYVEMARVTREGGASHHSYSRWVQYFVATAAVVVGALWLYR